MSGKPQDSGPTVQIGKCIDCRKPWTMRKSEKDWWDKRVSAEGLTFPKRCPDCRTQKRLNSATAISGELKSLSVAIEKGDFQNESKVLSGMLAELAEKVFKLENKPKTTVDLQPDHPQQQPA